MSQAPLWPVLVWGGLMLSWIARLALGWESKRHNFYGALLWAAVYQAIYYAAGYYEAAWRWPQHVTAWNTGLGLFLILCLHGKAQKPTSPAVAVASIAFGTWVLWCGGFFAACGCP